MARWTLNPAQTVLLIVDMQERLFHTIERSLEILQTIVKVVKGFQVLDLPILLSEQYPSGLGATIPPLQALLGEDYQPWIKTAFSCMDDPAFMEQALHSPYQQWVIVGIEAHVCVLQTAKGLLQAGKQVAVLNDAISSRSIYDFSTAIAEMRDDGIRITSAETILFELIKDSRAPAFKQISQLIKSCSQCHLNM